MNAEKDLQSLVELFSEQLPGFLAHEDMIPMPRLGHKLVDSADGSCIEAGVLALFYPRENRLNLVFTRRTDSVSSHQAQISFPGGRREPDEEFEQTAIRETNEELGVDPESVRILGRLTPLYVPPTNFCIYPVVGFAEERPDFRPSPDEVAEVIEVPVDHLLDKINIQRENWTIRGMDLEVPFYRFEQHKIWGATAMIVAELLAILRENRIKL
ncbi:NUDIX hydrolase [Acidobacteriota bacterium]